MGHRFTSAIGFLSNYAFARRVLDSIPVWIQVQSPTASFKYFSPAFDDLRLRALAGFEGWEDGGRRVATLIANHAKVVVDVGAYTGVYSLSAAAQSSSVRVIAVEPSEKAARAIERSAKANQFSQIQVIRAIASHRDGDTVELLAQQGRGTSTISVEPTFHSGETFVVDKRPTVRLDTLEITGVDFLKVDVEGHELAVLQGAESCIRENKPVVIIELLSDVTLSAVAKLMERLGYRSPQIVDSRKRNFLFVPENGKWSQWKLSDFGLQM